MKRRTLDILFSFGGLGIAGLLVVMGLVLASNANFAESYVTEQLQQQRITFKEAEKLTEEKRRSACVVANAGKVLSTGAQAECYANEPTWLRSRSSWPTSRASGRGCSRARPCGACCSRPTGSACWVRRARSSPPSPFSPPA